ncbi:MAG: NAD(P)H-hydrate dehydratase [Nanoarchaeota archaeon]|nr:NAD(P)H-hydrate dehydratase [Nanoarchaeota archaeon]MBU1005356.1 NAD(P)H-hydrate dehydratase [Nanoarchaeota archaeon]MBU1946088.1 NAD(P)H-hydrate dehydratase [Nanoarchaeota archaeon]
MVNITKKSIILPKRNPKSHKGDNGKVLIIGGSRDYTGAVALAGLAALRSGVDWVTIAAPEKVGYAINALSPDLVVKKYKGDDFCASRAKDILKLEKDFDAVLIGNGIGMHCKSFVNKYIQETKKPLVIDADALKHIKLQDVKNAILTPHKGEFQALLKNSKLNETNFQTHLKNNILLLKGPIDKIITSSRTYLNKTGNVGMTKAGTGDVLAGLCVGFLGQHLSLLQSAINAAYFNGLAGDILLKKKKGFTYLASDLVEEIKKLV